MTLTEKKKIVATFLARCNAYADNRIAEYQRRLETASPSERATLEVKITEWTTYRRFNDYTMGELGATTLDDWFDGSSGTTGS